MPQSSVLLARSSRVIFTARVERRARAARKVGEGSLYHRRQRRQRSAGVRPAELFSSVQRARPQSVSSSPPLESGPSPAAHCCVPPAAKFASTGCQSQNMAAICSVRRPTLAAVCHSGDEEMYFELGDIRDLQWCSSGESGVSALPWWRELKAIVVFASMTKQHEKMSAGADHCIAFCKMRWDFQVSRAWVPRPPAWTAWLSPMLSQLLVYTSMVQHACSLR